MKLLNPILLQRITNAFKNNSNFSSIVFASFQKKVSKDRKTVPKVKYPPKGVLPEPKIDPVEEGSLLIKSADELAQDGKFEQAMKLLKQVALNNPLMKINSILSWVKIQIEKNNLDIAKKLAASALELDPYNLNTQSYLGSIAFLQSKNKNSDERKILQEESSQWFKKVLANDETFLPALQNYSLLLASLGQIQESIAMMKRCTHLYAEDVGELWSQLGKLQIETGYETNDSKLIEAGKSNIREGLKRASVENSKFLVDVGLASLRSFISLQKSADTKEIEKAKLKAEQGLLYLETVSEHRPSDAVNLVYVGFGYGVLGNRIEMEEKFALSLKLDSKVQSIVEKTRKMFQ